MGDLGPEAYRFADFLEETGQGLWQILPLGHISYGNSPYMCLSAFGGNPYLISLERLAGDGLLREEEIASPPGFPDHKAGYGRAIEYKMPLLSRSFQRFKEKCSGRFTDDYYAFVEENAFWLEDYALFTALKGAHQGLPWTHWGEGLSMRDPEALVEARNSLADEVQLWKYLQYQFFKQWTALKKYCNEKAIRIIGDIPVYVAHDSAEVWAHRRLFHLDEQGMPRVVAGVPPDYFSASGQRWGNPIYAWEVMRQGGFRWWIDRFRVNFKTVDMVRLDHFRGFEAYWEIPSQEKTAVNGRWVQGPGMEFFGKVASELGALPMIAEDLGVITPEVDELRNRTGLPGMRILQMAFGDDPKAREYRPHNYIHNSVVYTATHDHNTTVGWFTSEPGTQSTQSPEQVHSEREYAMRYADSDGSEIHWDFIRLAMGSVARMAIFPLQDVLGLGTGSRMNLPGTPRGNWEWRFTWDMTQQGIRKRLRNVTRTYEREPRPGQPANSMQIVPPFQGDNLAADFKEK